MRNRFLVTYDVTNDRILKAVFKKMKTFGLHMQYSVFECELSERELALMKAALDRLIHHGNDQVLIADLGPADGRGSQCISSLGRAHVPVERKPVVV